MNPNGALDRCFESRQRRTKNPLDPLREPRIKRVRVSSCESSIRHVIKSRLNQMARKSRDVAAITRGGRGHVQLSDPARGRGGDANSQPNRVEFEQGSRRTGTCGPRGVGSYGQRATAWLIDVGLSGLGWAGGRAVSTSPIRSRSGVGISPFPGLLSLTVYCRGDDV